MFSFQLPSKIKRFDCCPSIERNITVSCMIIIFVGLKSVGALPFIAVAQKTQPFINQCRFACSILDIKQQLNTYWSNDIINDRDFHPFLSQSKLKRVEFIVSLWSLEFKFSSLIQNKISKSLTGISDSFVLRRLLKSFSFVENDSNDCVK